MYRCGVCSNPSHPGEKRKVRTFLRPNGQIAREVSVCTSCYNAQSTGYVTEGIDLEKAKMSGRVLTITRQR